MPPSYSCGGICVHLRAIHPERRTVTHIQSLTVGLGGSILIGAATSDDAWVNGTRPRYFRRTA
jgi:hypothetical protein